MGVPWIPSHFPQGTYPGLLNPTASMGVCPAKPSLKGVGDQGYCLEGWVEEDWKDWI